jgi:hypothetical protein
MTFSTFLVLIALIGIAYWFIMRSFKIKKEEVDEKLTEVGEIEEINEKIKDVNVNDVLKKRSKIDNLRREI